MILEKIIIKQIEYNADELSFGCFNDSKSKFNWQYCREHFSGIFNKHKYIVFKTGDKQNTTKVAKFISLCEKKLKIKPSKFYISQHKDLIIKLSNFWRQQHFRIDVLTILLRCGLYYKKSFDYALKKDEYSYETIDYIKKFLNGKTKLLNEQNYYGWYDTFSENGEYKINIIENNTEDVLDEIFNSTSEFMYDYVLSKTINIGINKFKPKFRKLTKEFLKYIDIKQKLPTLV